jgi:hypothetical protein
LISFNRKILEEVLYRLRRLELETDGDKPKEAQQKTSSGQA